MCLRIEPAIEAGKLFIIRISLPDSSNADRAFNLLAFRANLTADVTGPETTTAFELTGRTAALGTYIAHNQLPRNVIDYREEVLVILFYHSYLIGFAQ